jgi:hypothetical protein
MINKSILNPYAHSFNEFTLMLKEKCEKEGEVLVRMRNGNWVPVSWEKRFEDGEDCSEFNCYKNGCCFVWEDDGTSVTSLDFDLIEFKN